MTPDEAKRLSRGISADMSPEAIGRRLDVLRELYEAHRRLSKAVPLGSAPCGPEELEVPEPKTPAEVEAAAAGVDLSLIHSNLRLTPEERVIRHQAALERAEEMARAGRRLRGEDETR